MTVREPETISLTLPADLIGLIDRAVRRRQQAFRNEPTTRETVIRQILHEHFQSERAAIRAGRSQVPGHVHVWRSE